MNLIDIYYRAFKEYRKQTLENKACYNDRKAIKKANEEADQFQAIKYLCIIEEDWVKAIEEGLEFVEKAVREERQFIRANGEVVEIQKVKKISKETVEHLARHSDLITHVPENEGDDIVPDKLYMVEKLSDYAVYENRFLYMMLCYLRDFIQYRLEKIEKYRMTYIGDFTVSKEIITKKRELVIETKIHDMRTDNPYPILDDSSNDILVRIKNCQQIILSLLSTDLMVQVSKSPMIKPPIVKTNVLKMNNNFKRSLALYDYVATYKGLGFEAKEIVYDLSPFSEKIADEMAETLNLAVFLTYKHGNNIEEILENEYQLEEVRRKEEEARKLVEQINRLKKRALESNKTMEEYMLLLEKRNRMLERDSEELVLARHEIEKLTKVIEELNLEKEELNRKIKELEEVIEEKIREINYLNQKYIEDMAALRKQYAIEIAELKAAHEAEINQLNEEHAAEVNRLNEEHAAEITRLNEEHAAEVAQLTENYENQIAELNANHEKEVADLNEKYTNEINNLNTKYQDEIAELKLQFANERQEIIDRYEMKLDDLQQELEKARQEHEDAVEDYENKVLVLNEKIKDLTAENRRLIKDYEEKLKNLETNYTQIIADNTTASNNTIKQLQHHHDLMKAQLDSIRIQHGLLLPSEDLTSKERFSELETEFEAFNTFFKEQWKLTKKEIRKKLLWTKEDKAKLKQLQKEEKQDQSKANQQ